MNWTNREKQKLAEADDANLGQDVKDRILERLRDLEQERTIRLEVLSTNREQLRTQMNRVRETIQRLVYENTTLAERIRTLFREQRITIASVITAIGFAICTIVSAMTGGGGQTSFPSPSPPPPSPADKSWVKKQLEHLTKPLKKLTDKALHALPGILGSIVSWLLSTASKVVSFMAENLWSLALFVVALVFSKIKSK